MKKHTLLTLFCLFFSFIQLFSQSDFRKGYVITLQHDTLRGLVDFQSANINAEQCTYKQTLDGASQKYLPGEIIGYRYEKDGKFFVSKKFKLADNPEKQIFAEYLIEGKVSIYYYHEGVKAHYLLEKEGLPLTDAPFGKKVISTNQLSTIKNGYADTKYSYNISTYKGLLRTYMTETPELWNSIDRMGDPSHKNMIKLAKKYHQLACNNQECIVYEKTLPQIRVSIEPIMGFVFFKGIDKFSLQYGALGYLWMPQNNERVYLKMGYLYSYLDLYEHSYSVKSICIPFQIEYLFPKAIIRPKFYTGVNTYITNEKYSNLISDEYNTGYSALYLYTVGSGLEIPVTDYMSIDFSFNCDFIIFPSVNTDVKAFNLFSYVGMGGIKIRL